MIAGAKKYATDHPDQIELTTLACKTNDDTPCQIAQIQDTSPRAPRRSSISPMGAGVARLQKALQAGVKIVFVDNTVAGVVPMPSRRRTTSRAARRPAPTSRPS